MEHYYVQTTNEKGEWVNLFGPYEDEVDAFNRLRVQRSNDCGYLYRVWSKSMGNKYPLDIVKCVRQHLGLDENDGSLDDGINTMSRDEVFEIVCNWNGLINYASKIKSWVNSIYQTDI